MSIVQLTSSQRRRLRRQLRCARDASHYRRLLAVLELDRGQSVGAVASLLRVTRQSVYNWANAFAICPQPAALENHYDFDRPCVWTEELQGLLLTALEQHPDDLGYTGVNWTVPLLCVKVVHCSEKSEIVDDITGLAWTLPFRRRASSSCQQRGAAQ